MSYGTLLMNGPGRLITSSGWGKPMAQEARPENAHKNFWSNPTSLKEYIILIFMQNGAI